MVGGIVEVLLLFRGGGLVASGRGSLVGRGLAVLLWALWLGSAG